MLALTVAFFTAALALAGKVVSDRWTLHQQKCGIAAALAGEINAYTKTFNANETVPAFEKLAEADYQTRCKRLRALPKQRSAHPVFDKVAEKIGLLPIKEATDVSTFYNFISGTRVLLSHMSSAEFVETDDEVQVVTIRFLMRQSEEYFLLSADLTCRLQRIADQPFLPWPVQIKLAGLGSRG